MILFGGQEAYLDQEPPNGDPYSTTTECRMLLFLGHERCNLVLIMLTQSSLECTSFLLYTYKTGHTFVLGCELFHDHGERFVEPLLLGDKGLADCVVIILHHAHVASNLVDKRLQ